MTFIMNTHTKIVSANERGSGGCPGRRPFTVLSAKLDHELNEALEATGTPRVACGRQPESPDADDPRSQPIIDRIRLSVRSRPRPP